MSPIHRTMTLFEWGLLGLLSILWGGTFFFVAVAVKEMPPLTIVFLRLAIASLVLLAVLRVLGLALPRERRAWALIAGMSVLNNVVPFSLFAWAQTAITGGLASIFNATTPLFAVLIAHLTTADEKLTVSRLAGVVLGVAGVAVTVGPSFLDGLGDHVSAQLACLLGAASYGVSGILGRRIQALGVAPPAIATGQVIVSSLILLPVALSVDRPWTLPLPSPSAWLAIVALGVLSTALAYLIFFRILATAGATNLMLVTFLIPISAILLGSALLGERLEARQAGGMALIACGLAAIDGRLIRRLRGAPRPAA